VGTVVTTVAGLIDAGGVDELVVVDDGSTNGTAAVAAAVGARVVASRRAKKGQALREAVGATTAEMLVFLDAAVVNFTPRYVTALTSALGADPGLKLAKATYGQPLHGRPGEGYRIKIGMLVDTYLAYGRSAVAEVDVGGERVHRNRPLHELTVHARDVRGAVLARTGIAVPVLVNLPALS
jgi:glucosyl-3-phosphoglycerate synthase